jgi:molybdopterin/thiamine biosynthesis adenylyltransferase
MAEHAALSKLAAHDSRFQFETWRQEGTAMVVRGTFIEANYQWPFKVFYPHLFPSVCPYVRPQDVEARWSSHQFGDGGSLCLEIGPDNWSPMKTGADLLESMARLLVSESRTEGNEFAEVPSRHEETRGQSLIGDFYRFVSIAELKAGLAAATESHGPCLFGKTLSAEACMVWGKELPIGTPLTAPHGLIRGSILTAHGYFFKLDFGTEFSQKLSNLPMTYELAELLVQNALGDQARDVLKGLAADTFVVIIFGFKEPLLFRVSDDGEKRRLKSVPAAEDSEGMRIPSALALKAKELTVAIVGLGSIGSKVALTLARCGFRKFVLVDDDILQPGNVVRHEGTYEDMGAHKVDLVADNIHLICDNEPKITKHKFRILGQTSPRNYGKCIAALMASDVIIDCTADIEVFQYLGALASEQRRPYYWAEVFAGGIGGIVGSALPNSTPCPSCLRRALIDFLTLQPPAPNRDDQDPYGSGPLQADDAAVRTIASLLSSRVVNHVTGDRTDVHDPLWIVGLVKKWIFGGEADILRPRALCDDYSCQLCWVAEITEESLSAEETAQLHTLRSKIDLGDDATSR